VTLDFTPALKRIQSMVQATGLFTAGVVLHEPKNAPGKGLFCAMWLEEIGPVPSESGQNVTTGRVAFTVRVYLPMLTQPEERIDQKMGGAVGAIMGLLSGDIDLQDNVKYVDLLGATGTPLSAKGGYVTIDTTMFRIMDIVCPLIINDIWLQGV
jgi:hypothetical protein